MKNNAHFISDDAQLNQHCLKMHSLKCPRPLRCVASIFGREADFPVYTDSGEDGESSQRSGQVFMDKGS